MARVTKKSKITAHKKGKSVSVQRKTGTVWVVAIDPFGGVDLQPIWNFITPLSDQFKARIEVAYVLAPSSMNWTGAFSGPWMKKYIPVAERALNELVPDSEIKKVIVECQQSGQRAAVKSLIHHAEKVKAQCIVISTHARKGLDRLTMGSFAETVILTSKIPVLVVNPSKVIPKVIRKILVPTDLSKRSGKYVASVAEYAKSLNAEIVLFHKQADPLDPIIQQGVYSLGGGWVSVQSYIDDDLEIKNRELLKLEESLRKKHINVSHIFDSSPEGLVESIERAARDGGADMVSVLTQSGTWSAALLGSVARGLVRNSSLPVLVRR